MASTVVITVNRRQLRVDSSLNLLDALAGEDIFLSAACGGRGSCGTCKCSIQSPVVSHSLKEIPYLSATERASGIHLACQTCVETKMQLGVSELVLAARSCSARIRNIEFIDNSQAIVSLEADGTGLSFSAGQFALLQIIPAPTTAPIRRAYSFISSPRDSRFPAFLITLKKGGTMSDHIREKAVVGDSVTLIGPYGEFQPFTDADNELWIASSSGISPFLSMLNDTKLWEAKKTRRTLIYRSKAESIAAIQKKVMNSRGTDPNFRFYTDLTMPHNETLVKIVHKFLQAGATIPGRVLICASAPEVDACTNLLMRVGVNASHIRRDAF